MKKKRIAIDLNDVIRGFTNKFEDLYIKEINSEFDLNETIFNSDGDFYKIFPFPSKLEFQEFAYQDYALELYGMATTPERLLTGKFNLWLEELSNYNNIELLYISPNENFLSLQGTCFFLSKLCRLRKILFPTCYKEIWDNSDIIITANPSIIKHAPKNKKIIKINTLYNKDYYVKDNFDKLSDLIEYKKNILVKKNLIEVNKLYKVVNPENKINEIVTLDKKNFILYKDNKYYHGDSFIGCGDTNSFIKKGKIKLYVEEVIHPWHKIICNNNII